MYLPGGNLPVGHIDFAFFLWQNAGMQKGNAQTNMPPVMRFLSMFGVTPQAVAQCASNMGFGDAASLQRVIENNGQGATKEMQNNAMAWAKNNPQMMQQGRSAWTNGNFR